MKTYELLTGEVLSVAELSAHDVEFLEGLARDAKGGTDYFDLLRRVKGPEAVPLRAKRITPQVANSVLYRVAHDIADRVGIAQGYLLAPEADRSTVEYDAELLSLTEAADLIGISRPAAHQALTEGRLSGRRVGNAWVVRRPDAEMFRQARSARSASVATAEALRVASRCSR